ncbi:MAG: alpha/beta hydrolase [Oscillospiraceae bacterium]|nr:alpha/beta hydrolase [Oscillospiraceae bacterium]
MPQLEIYKKPKKIVPINIIIIIIFSIILLLAAVLWFIGNYFYNNFIKSVPYNTRIAGNAPSVPGVDNGQVTELEMTSRDGLKLIAYEVVNETASHNWVIVVHGYKSSAKQMESYINNFYKLGFNVLAPDLRGHGLSEGDYIGMGVSDRLDVLDWAKEIIDKDEKSNICLYGLSMGAATVMMVSGEDVPLNIKCIVEDCGYASVYSEFSYRLKEQFKLPDFPVLNAADMITKIKAGYTFEEGSPFLSVGRSKTPILFIHGDKDDYVPFSDLQILYDYASCEKDIFIVEGAGHAQSEEVAGALYWDKIKTFIQNYEAVAK